VGEKYDKTIEKHNKNTIKTVLFIFFWNFFTTKI
jgi:hypothetical protein